MSNILKGLTYSYSRNIGWQDRIIRTIFGFLSLAVAVYFYSDMFNLSIVLAGIFLAQLITVLSSRCMICYFLGQCTITSAEKESLSAKGVPYEE